MMKRPRRPVTLDFDILISHTLMIMRTYARILFLYLSVLLAVYFAQIILLVAGIVDQHSLAGAVMELIAGRCIPIFASAAVIMYIDRRERRHRRHPDEILAETANRFVPLVVTILVTLLVDLIGFFFFIIPGVIFLLMFSQSYFFTLLKGISNPFRSLSASEQSTRGHRFSLLLLYSAFAVMYLLSMSIFDGIVPDYFVGTLDIGMSTLLLLLNYSVWSILNP